MARYATIIVLAVPACGCWPVDVDVHPRDAYAMIAGLKGSETVPASIKNLQADGAAWMDMRFCCRFTAPEGVIKSIIDSGFKQIAWDEIASEMMTEHYTKRFTPKWNPAAITQEECFLKAIETS